MCSILISVKLFSPNFQNSVHFERNKIWKCYKIWQYSFSNIFFKTKRFFCIANKNENASISNMQIKRMSFVKNGARCLNKDSMNS